MASELWTRGYSGVGLIDPVTVDLRKCLLSYKKAVVTSLFLRSGNLCLLPFSVLGFCLLWICVGLLHAVSLWVHVYQSCFVQKMLFPWSNPISLALKIHLLPSLQRFLSLNRRYLEKITHIGWVLWSLSASVRCPVVGLWIN